MRNIVVSALLASAALVAAAAAQVHVKEEVITAPGEAAWQFDGGPKVKIVDAAALPGGKALEVTVPKKLANPWDMQARAVLASDIAVGDTVTFGFYARAATPDPGKTTIPLSLQVQRNAAPYDATVAGTVEIGADWTFHCITGQASKPLTKSELMVTAQLSGEKHVIDFGPFLATKIPAAGGANAKSGLPCGKAPGAA